MGTLLAVILLAALLRLLLARLFSALIVLLLCHRCILSLERLKETWASFRRVWGRMKLARHLGGADGEYELIAF